MLPGEGKIGAEQEAIGRESGLDHLQVCQFARLHDIDIEALSSIGNSASVASTDCPNDGVANLAIRPARSGSVPPPCGAMRNGWQDNDG